jgi:hypothetical protein
MPSWLKPFRPRRHPARRTARLAVTALECRVVPVAGDFIVTNTQNLQVYSPTGQLRSTHPIPVPGDIPARDLIVDGTDQTATHVYNGTQAVPFLSNTIDDGQTWDNVSGPAGWSTDNANNMGGIAAFDQFVFATDMDVSGDGNGIIRWDLTDNSSQRVVSGTDYADLTIGLDGKLYALQPATGSPQVIDVYDPLTLDKFPSVTLPAGPNFTGIAVDKDGRIYAVSWNTPDVYRFSPTGQLQRHRRLQEGELNNLLDIDISDDNRLLMGNDKGFAVRLPVANFIGTGGGTLAPSAYRRFQIKEPDGTDAAGPVFVAWADPQKITLPHVTVTGRKFEDLNTNGVRNTGELGLAGWTVFADLNANGTLDTGEPSAVTDDLGNYSLDVNLNGQTTFRLMEQPQRGWAETFSPTATADQPTAAHPYYTLTFTDGNQANKDFGNHRTDFVVTPAGGLLTAETGFSATFTVVLTAPPTSDVTIPVSSSDPSEGAVSTATLTFTSSNWNVPQTVTVTGQPDGVADGNVAYTIDLGPSSSLDPNYDGLSHSVAATNFDSTPVDKVGIFRGLPRRWTLDAFNDGVYTPDRDRRYTKLGAGQTIVGDWDGDGYDDLGLFRPDTGTFTLFVNGGVFKTITRLDGKVGGRPLVGDWNGVPGDEVGLFRGLTGTFVLDADGDGVSNDPDDRVGAMLDGQVGGVPLVGNWDGLGGEEVGLYRPLTGTFTLDRDGDLASNDASDTVIARLAGKVGGKALVGDWDGDGDADVGLFSGLTGQWFLDTNGDPQAERTITKLDGAVGGRAVVGDFNGDGMTDCGLFRPLTGKWTIDLNHNGVYDAGVDLQYFKVDGLTGGVPLVGKWKLP